MPTPSSMVDQKFSLWVEIFSREKKILTPREKVSKKEKESRTERKNVMEKEKVSSRKKNSRDKSKGPTE